MSFPILLVIVLVSMLVIERIWLHIYVKPRGRSLSFREFSIRATYKPLFVILAVGRYFTLQDPDFFAILLTGVFAGGSVAISYLLARRLYPRYLASQAPSEDATSY